MSQNIREEQSAPTQVQIGINDVSLAASNDGRRLFVISSKGTLSTFSLEQLGISIFVKREGADTFLIVEPTEPVIHEENIIPDLSQIAIGNTYNGIFFNPLNLEVGASGLGTTEIFTADPVFLSFYSASFTEVYARTKDKLVQVVRAESINIRFFEIQGQDKNFWEITTFFKAIVPTLPLPPLWPPAKDTSVC